MRGYQDAHGYRGDTAGEGHPVRNSLVAAAGIAALILAKEGLTNNSQAQEMTYQRLVATGQVMRGAFVDLDKGRTLFDRPAVFNNEQGTSAVGALDAAEKHKNPIIIRGFDNRQYMVTVNPELSDMNPPTTLEELSKVGVMAQLQPGELQFKKGTANVAPVPLGESNNIPVDADITVVGEAE